MSYIVKCLEKFRELPEEAREIMGGINACLSIEKIEDEYGIKLGFLVILVGIGELSLDKIFEYLIEKYSLSEDDAVDIQNELNREIFSKLLYIKNEEPLISEDKIKEYFKSYILSLLKDDNLSLEINKTIFAIFVYQDSFPDELLRVFLANKELIGNVRIFLNHSETSPTIENWIKDFISKYGSDNFSDVALAEYLSLSENAKKLNKDDKESLRKVLRTYYNLSFFPDSVDGLKADDWQILPVDKKILTLSNEVSLESVETASRGASLGAEPTDRQKIIFDLQKSLTRYPNSSLEYKAIHQEINRLSRK